MNWSGVGEEKSEFTFCQADFTKNHERANWSVLSAIGYLSIKLKCKVCSKIDMPRIS